MAGIGALRSGEVRLSGRPLGGVSRRERARRIGYLPQIVRPSVAYTVYELVALGRYPHASGLGFESGADRDAIRRAMSLTHTHHLAARPFSEISGGERQRALIASVLAGEPEVILLDEPTASLDIARSAEVFIALKELAHLGRAVGVVTHDLNLAGQLADEVVLMSEGCIIAAGPPASVLAEKPLRAAYGDGFVLVPHPESDVPAVLPAREVKRG
jgi:iron complex transport system ATP-binding protein